MSRTSMVSGGFLPLLLLCLFVLTGCSDGTATNQGPSERELTVQAVENFGTEGTIVEVYSDRYGVDVGIENDNGERIRALARWNQTPARGDRWSLKKSSNSIWPRLDQRIRD